MKVWVIVPILGIRMEGEKLTHPFRISSTIQKDKTKITVKDIAALPAAHQC